ncbi:hypothetical protein R2B67_26195 [Streptomyces cyaneofuscatus]|uniref:hypothetical protein n=1 Tax=Streptomyces cyaneofuscatus TaxID=66883 RepID=UPI0029548948|nr:hypothetical protein [Streptomyces cyaneofuscatus]WOP11812.1 hypothetical protein R2B67_26195 [Streptomyces cyaneofuscatus]
MTQSDDLDITIKGVINLPDSTVITCPECGASEGLTLYGKVDGAGRLMCPTGHHFDPPARVDAVALLANAAADPRFERF